MDNPHFSKTTDGLEKSEQFYSFRREMAEFGVESHAVVRPESEGFHLKITGHACGSTVAMNVETEGFLVKRDKKSQTSPNIDHWLLGLWLVGSGDFDIGGQSVRTEQGQLQLQQIHRVHDGLYSMHDIFYVMLPRDSLKGLESALDGICKVDSANAFHPLLNEYLRILAKNVPFSPGTNQSAVEEATLSMVRACILRSPEAIEAASSAIVATQLEAAKRLIAANLWSSRLNIEAIAAHMAMSRRQLYKIFETEGGVEHYIRTRRLEESFRNISTAGQQRRIGEIAEQLGFRDLPSFGKQFRAQFGLSPGEIRGAADQSPGPETLAMWASGQSALAKDGLFSSAGGGP
ncbi:AraC-like DNA-binding protein [Hoeflea marina]|uniref:AraC-like DNA-binding protein n=1 Tax=Hoeflea marina TaxID=274592 RepID=A0A317PFX2_9HYPH|nr:helix-turn-helix domain-containing protein [Hoeflea marina]PWV95163.1 AraC-like DNA-binding protein [Hoeflea marina]